MAPTAPEILPSTRASPTFQPQTSYRWAKLTDRPNPVLSLYENKLEGLKQEFSLKGLRPERNRELKRSLDETHRVISELKSKSFLISDADPFIVVPSFMVGDNTEAFSPSIGDYAAVIYNGKIYPAIVGDAGPSNKIGKPRRGFARNSTRGPQPLAAPSITSKLAISFSPEPPKSLARPTSSIGGKNANSSSTKSGEQSRNFTLGTTSFPPGLLLLPQQPYSHCNSHCHCNSLCQYNSFRRHGSFRNPCSFAIAFTKPFSRTNASGSFNGDRAATPRHAFPQSRACRPSWVSPEGAAHSMFF